MKIRSFLLDSVLPFNWRGRPVRPMAARTGEAPVSHVAHLLIATLLACFITFLPAHAQVPDEPGSALSVYVLTMQPGDLIWEKFGHNALWIHDADRNTNTIYNWGWFDFDQEWFFIRFLHGRMWYSLQADEAIALRDLYLRLNPRLPRHLPPEDWLVLQYIIDDRTVWVQELNLAPAQRAKLQQFLDWNVRPENKNYDYDYYIDNCSTRVRDAMDLALDGQLSAQTQDVLTDSTYRWHTRRLMHDAIGWYTTLHGLLGQTVERPISIWEEMFLPLELMDHLRAITVRDADGNEIPLVRSEWPLYQSETRAPGPEEAPQRSGMFLLAGLLIGGLIVGLGELSRRSRFARIGFTAVSIPCYVYTGVLGLVLVYGWIFTNHWAGYRNENLLQFNPLGLAMVILAPMMVFGRALHARRAYWVMVAIVVCSVLGIILKLLPWFHQTNGEIIALVLPIHAGTLFAAWRISRSVITPPEPDAADEIRTTVKGKRKRGRSKSRLA
jgi:hypothetical protein